MTDDSFITGQRKGVNIIFAMVASLATVMWCATALDVTFDLQWGWDRQILWLAPLMVLFAAIVRFFAKAIFKFVEGND